MDAGLAVGAGPRSSFRKPSHDTSLRNYRRRSPASARSSSSSPSPAPVPGPSGGWKRDRSASPSSPRRDGATRYSLHSKKGRIVHEGKDDSDEDSQGRLGERARGASDRLRRGSSYDRYGKPDLYSSRRSGSSQYDRNSQPSSRHTGRDPFGDSRRNGDHDPSSRHRQSPDRGHVDGSRSRDKDLSSSRDRGKDGEAIVKSRAHGRESNSERDLSMEGRPETDRDRARDRDRDRARERSRSRERDRERGRGGRSARDSYSGRDGNVERRYDESRSRERDRERVRSRHTSGDLSIGNYDAGEIDGDRSGDKERGRDRDRGKEKDKQHSKSGGRNVSSPRHSFKENVVWGEDKVKESQKDLSKDKIKSQDSDRDIELRKDVRQRSKEGHKDRDREFAEDDEVVRDFSIVDMGKEKDVGKTRDKSRIRDSDSHRDPDIKEQGRRRDRDRQGDVSDIDKARDFKGKDEGKEFVRFKDRDESRERSRYGDKEDHRGRVREKQDWGTMHEHHRTSHRQNNDRSGNRISGTSDGVSHWDKDKETGSDRHTYEAHVKDRTPSSTLLSDQAVKAEKDRHQSTKVKDIEGGDKVEFRDGVVKDRDCIKHDSESTPQASILVPITGDSDKTGTAAILDGKAIKVPSKWGPEASDSTATASASEELTSDLSAAKLAAMKAAELVNKNLGVAGFMSADQKKRLLWGSKKLATEQEPAMTAGSNRWDTVHFSDPDRQEKFHKLMGVKADANTESKKEGEIDPGIFTEEKQRELQQDLEKQFTAGLRRRDGGKVGLGL